MKDISIILYNYFKTKYFHRFKTQKKLRIWQKKKIQKFKKKILVKSAFYRDLINKDLSSFPIINKQIMMENFNAINTAKINKSQAMELALKGELNHNFSRNLNGVTIGLSSGTSGNRGLFLVSEIERLKWAGTILAKTLPKSIFKKCKIAFFLRINSNLYTTVQKNNSIKFEFYDLSVDLPKHLQRLNKNQPDLLVAPAQMLRLLANKQNANQLHINPSKIISVAEVLEPLDKKYIENCFNKPVNQIYQCMEGFLGYTCKYGTLHLNEDLIFIEKKWIDKKNRRFIPIITDFSRTTQPIVRYNLNDILIEKKDPCPCGSVFCSIEKIEGRCDDIFYFPSKKHNKLTPVFPDFIRRSIISSSEDILQYHVIQHKPDQIEIILSSKNREETQNNISKNLKMFFQKINVIAPQIQFSTVFKNNLKTKLRRVESKLKIKN